MIGILDSGIGGLAFAKAFADAFPSRDIVYFGDTARWPYGGKSPETISSFALEGAEFLVEIGVRLLVVSCHDISAVALEPIKERFPVETIGAIAPSAAKALEISSFSRIGVIASRAVVDSGSYERTIKSIAPEASVHCVVCPLLSVLAMEGWLKKPETNMIFKKCIHPLKVRQIDTLVAGAAEFSLLRNVFVRKAGKRIKVVDPVPTLAECLADRSDLKVEPEKKGRTRFFVSDLTPCVEIGAKRFYGKNLVLEKVTVWKQGK